MLQINKCQADITLYEFNSLEGLEKIEALGEYGELVAHRFEDEFKCMLYQVNNFYVELKYITEGNIFVQLNTFNTTQRLEPYLNKINIDLK